MKKLFALIGRHTKEMIIIVSLLLVGVISFAFVRLFSKDGTSVIVSVNGETVGEYSLYFDAEYQIGEGNVLTVSGGKAYMSYADCPDHTCKNMGKISALGEKIICLPNKVMVEIK